MSTVPHYVSGKRRNVPPVGTAQYTSATISVKQLLKDGRSSEHTIWKSDNENPDYGMHPNVPCFSWVNEEKVFQNFHNLKIPQSLLRRKGIRDYDQVDAILNAVQEELVFVGFASKETVNPNNGIEWDEKVAVEINEPKAVRITEPNGVKIGDWIKPVIPDPRIKDTRYYATFEKVPKKPENVVHKKMIALKNIQFEESGLCQLTF